MKDIVIYLFLYSRKKLNYFFFFLQILKNTGNNPPDSLFMSQRCTYVLGKFKGGRK